VKADSLTAVRKAIEFKGPTHIPIELVEVPGVWDDYGALPRSSCPHDFPPLSDFDSIQAIYSWVFRERGNDGEGNRLREDEWGCLQKVPRSGEYSYLVVGEPLRDGGESAYRFPDPSAADPWFAEMGRALRRYPGKFIDAFIDPGITLVALNIRGYENLLVDYYQDMKKVRWLFDGIWEYQKEIVRKWKRAGAHAVSFYEEWATQGRMYVPPEWWREHMKPFYARVIDFVHQEGMYAGMGLDGAVLPILDDLKEIGLDILDNRQPLLLGVDNLAKAGGGRLCIKASCDMQLSLPSRSPQEIEREAALLARRLGSDRGGGFMGLVFKWDRIKLPMENVLASHRGFRSQS
jgi:uroporphyrinogen decarboxylase